MLRPVGGSPVPRSRSAWWCLAVAAATACGDAAGPRTDPLEILGGDGQRAVVGSVLPASLEVRATDGRGRGVAGVAVRFTVVSGLGAVEPAETVTDERGRAAARWTLGTDAGEHRVSAAIDDAPAVTFRATAEPGPAATLVSVRDTVLLFVQDTLTPLAVARDAYGNVITERRPSWRVTVEALATVSAQGVLRGREAGEAILVGELDDARAEVPLVVTRWVAVTAGYAHSCALTLDGRAYCWGGQGYGELGSASGGGTSVPVPVRGGLRFSTITAGDRHTCALTPEGEAYCWGDNAVGQLGGGMPGATSSPQPVAGGHRFRTLTAAGSHTCGLTVAGEAYCWGSNETGQLGTGDGTSSTVPVPVQGGTFVELDGHGDHHCGVASDGGVQCWGLVYEYGSLDPQTLAWFRVQNAPVPVPGDARFDQLSVERFHACGVTTGGIALCWGDNAFGELGSATPDGSTVPVAVSGGLTFERVSAGAFHTCALTAGGIAYCWGFGTWGQLGTRETVTTCTSQQLKCAFAPVRVDGGHAFAVVDAGYTHTCAVTLSGVAYCWGFNRHAQTGSASGSIHEPQPVRVPSPR